MLQNQEHEKGITREPQKYDEQMMATEYIDNEAKIDNTSACTITSPPFAISPDLKTSPISGSRHVTKRNLKNCDIETSNHESVSHQTSHSVSTSLPDVMSCRKMSSGDHCALSFSITEKRIPSSSTLVVQFLWTMHLVTHTSIIKFRLRPMLPSSRKKLLKPPVEIMASSFRNI